MAYHLFASVMGPLQDSTRSAIHHLKDFAANNQNLNFDRCFQFALALQIGFQRLYQCLVALPGRRETKSKQLIEFFGGADGLFTGHVRYASYAKEVCCDGFHLQSNEQLIASTFMC